MNEPLQDPTAIIAAGLNYWSEWVAQLNHLPSEAFAQKHELILHAVKLGLGLPATRRAAVDLTLTTFLTVVSGGYWPAWQPVLEAARAHAWPNLDQRRRVRLLSRLGQCYRFDNQLAQAAAVHHEAEGLAAQLPEDSVLACEIAFQLAEDYRRQSEFTRASEYALVAWKLVETDEEQNAWRASVANAMGLIEWATGELAKADHWFTVAAAFFSKSSRPVELSRVLNNLGGVLLTQGKLDEALIVYEQALSQLEETSAWLEKLKVQYNIGVIHFDKAEYDRAEDTFRKANLVVVQYPAGAAVLGAYVSHSLGNAILKQGRFAEAEPFLRAAIDKWEVMGDKLNQGDSMAVLAQALGGQGRLDATCATYRQALMLLEKQRHIPRGEHLYQEHSQAFLALDCRES